MKRFYILILVILYTAITLTGCSKDRDDDVVFDFELPEYIYLTEIIRFPGIITDYMDIGAVALSEDSVFFTAWGQGGEDLTFHSHSFFVMNFNGTGFTELPNHSSNSIRQDAMGGDMYGNAQINHLHADDEGNIWTVESGSYSLSNWHEDQHKFVFVRKLDRTGKMLHEIDISSLAAGYEHFYISAFKIDAEENIYIAVGTEIYVLDPQGNTQFILNAEDYVMQMKSLKDGTVAQLLWQPDMTMLNTIDTVNQRWGEKIMLPDSVINVFPGSEEYPVLFNRGLLLNGICAETGEVEQILNWLDSGLVATEVIDLVLSSDGRITVALQTQRGMTGSSAFELVHLTKVPYSELPERTTLTLGTLRTGPTLSDAVIQFNRKSTTHRIHIIDYSKYNVSRDSTEGYTRMITEIISGRSPDIICLTGLPFAQFASRDMFVDLYPFLDADAVLNRDVMIGNLLNEDKVDGKLFRIIPSFNINTLIGSAALLGTDPGWNIEEFLAVLEANPQADIPMGTLFSSQRFLQYSLFHGMHNYIDRDSGTVDFDNDKFIELLELADTFPTEIIWSSDQHILTGRQIMTSITIGEFDAYMHGRALYAYGGRTVIKGFPTEDRSGHLLIPLESMAITARSKNIEGAWEFIRSLLLEDFQRNHITQGFPANKMIFEERVEGAKNPPWGRQEITYVHEYGPVSIPVSPLMRTEAEVIMDILDNIRILPEDEALMNIITESASDFFNRRISAQDAARIIQSRAGNYISEQRR